MSTMDYHQSNPRNRLPSYQRTYSATSSSSGPYSTGTPRPGSQLSREAVYDPKDTTHIASDFLRSALERERATRRTTFDRHNDRMAHQDRFVHSSPISRAATADPSRRRHRADSSTGGGDHQGPMGAKEASETISKLHNENFNLKLEVYHRREREVSLEERIQKLEAELQERDQIESSLRADLVNRDTEIKTQTAAVQEAVNVIMDLESKLEKYRQEGAALDEDDDAAPNTPTPGRGPSRLEDEITALARMPSFVSDLSANTENLRNVYLNNQGSALNLPRDNMSDARGPSFTPSLSILDEIYGDVRQPRAEPQQPPPPREPTPAREPPTRKTKEEKRQAIERALGDMPPALRQGRYEKREPLHPVMTGMPVGRDILPPTPDTMTSSTLERGKGSKDTLSRRPSIPDNAKGRPPVKASLSNPSAAPSVTAFHDRRGLDPIPRPRSASEATTAPRWDLSDTESMESDVDIWLRERGRASPDLFSFPSTGPRWDSDQMFGIASATNTLTGGPAPPPPNRRSSLQARTSTPGRPKTRGTPSIVRSDRYNDFFDDRDGATPPPIQLKRVQAEPALQPEDGGVSLQMDGGVPLNGPHNPTPPATAVSQTVSNHSGSTQPTATPKQTVTAPTTPTGPATPSSTGHKRRWFGLGRVGSLRKG